MKINENEPIRGRIENLKIELPNSNYINDIRNKYFYMDIKYDKILKYKIRIDFTISFSV